MGTRAVSRQPAGRTRAKLGLGQGEWRRDLARVPDGGRLGLLEGGFADVGVVCLGRRGTRAQVPILLVLRLEQGGLLGLLQSLLHQLLLNAIIVD